MLKLDTEFAAPAGVGVTVRPDGVLVVCGSEYPRGSSVTVSSCDNGNVRVRVFTPERSPLPAWRENLVRAREARRRNRDRGLAPDQALTDEQMREALLGLVRRSPGKALTSYTKWAAVDGGVRGDATRKIRLMHALIKDGLLVSHEVKMPRRPSYQMLTLPENAHAC